MLTAMKLLRMSRAIRQEDLAIRVGVSQPLISLIENRKRAPRPEIAEKIARALSADIRTLELLGPR